MMDSRSKMLPKKFRAVWAAVGSSSLTNETTQGPPRIMVLFLAALAVRKFQKFQSQIFKKSLSYDFDKNAALKELRSFHHSDKEFFKNHFVKLAYFTRKFDLSCEDLSSIDSEIVVNIFACLRSCCGEASSSSQRMPQFLCSTLKFLTRNSGIETNPLEMSDVVELMRKTSLGAIKNGLVSLLMHYFERLHLEHKSNSELLSSVLNLPDLPADAKAFFLGQLESAEASKRLDSSVPNDGVSKSMAVPRVKKNKQVVSKTVQTVKSKQETKHSEETDFQFLNLASGRAKNRNKATNYDTVDDDGLSEVKSVTGDDRSMWRSTWPEVLNLYSVVSRGEVLKDDDKDSYLHSKFLGTHYYFKTSLGEQKIYSFFINQMCSSMLLKVSRKQYLNTQTIDKLMECITDFNSLVAVLKVDREFVAFFVDVIFDYYWKFKDLDSPDMAFTFIRSLMEQTTEEYLSKGWIYNSTEVRKKSYDNKKVEALIVGEIKKIRVDAIKALYNSAVRNKKQVLTNERLLTIRKHTEEPDDDTFVDHIFRLIELAEELDDFDYKSTFNLYHGHLKNPKALAKVGMDAIIRFMNNQARDSNRANALFGEKEITTFIDCIQKNDTGLSSDQKRKIMDVINTYLEHEITKPLSEQNLDMLMDACLSATADLKLIKSGLTALLLSTDKTQRLLQKDLALKKSLPQNLLEKLIALFHSLIHSEECTSFLVFILSRVFCAQDSTSKKCFLEDQNFLELISSKMTCRHTVNLNDVEGERVQFETPSDNEANSNTSSNKISLLATKIVWRSIENHVLLSSATIDALILVLTGKSEEDKQTKIAAAKCLYGLTKYMSFDSDDYLNQLLDLINSPIYDVSVYVQTAYIRGCVKVAYAPLPVRLGSIHMASISDLYVADDSLKLGQDDFKDEINKNLFRTLLYAAGKQEFSDSDVFRLFDDILNKNERYAPEVLAILVAYSDAFVVPEATVRTLENLLSVSSYFEKALLVLENVILSGQVSVTSKTLHVFTDYLLLSTNSRLRFYSFKVLEQASQNQELPDEVFYQSELVRAGYALETSGKSKGIVDFVQSLVDKGMQLPIDTKFALEKEINDAGVLKILATVSKNKQIIDQHLLEALADMFDPENADDINILLVAIFESAVKNNQNLPHKLLVKLETALQKEDLKQNVLPVFIYLAQKGEALSQSVNNHLLDRLISDQDPVWRQELLSSLGSLIEANRRDIELYLPKINEILIREIKSDNHNIQKLCLGSIGNLVRVSKLIDNKLLEVLVEVGTDPNRNRTIGWEIQALFKSVITDDCNPLIVQKHYRETIQLANLVCSSHKDLLEQLRFYTKLEGGLLVENYKQLKEIIEGGSLEMRQEVLRLLHDCSSKCRITDEFLESVAILYESTVSEELRDSCLQLFNETVESGKTLNGRTRTIWGSKVNRGENISKFLRSPGCLKVEQEFQLSEQIITDLLQLIQETEKLLGVKEISELIHLIVEEDLDYWKNDSFVKLIEQCLLQTRALEIALPCYCLIIKDLQVCNTECLEVLQRFFENGQESDSYLETRFFEAMYYTSKFAMLPKSCMEFVVQNLGNGSENVRGYTLGILNGNNDGQYEEYRGILNAWCNIILVQNFGVDIREASMDLLETMVSVKFFDVEVFAEKREVWKRELLISDMLESFKVFHIDKVQFYMGWLAIEEKFNSYDKSCDILSLIQKCRFQTFSEVTDLLLMIPELDSHEVERILIIHGPEPFQAFKQSWCQSKLRACISSNSISSTYSRKLIKNLCSIFDVDSIGKLFRCLKSIDNLFAFEEVISLCLREKIDLGTILDVGDDGIQLQDLKHLIESKHLCKCATSPPGSQVQEKNFQQVFRALKDVGWNFAQLQELILAFNPVNNQFENLLYFLNTVLIYSLPSANFEKSLKILTDSTSFQEIMKKINKLVVENHFQHEGKVKDFNELLAELKRLNQSDEAFENLIESNSLDIRKHIHEDQSDKLKWNEKQILLWAKDVKSSGKEFSDYEAIAIFLRANFIVTGHTLTDTQILCCLIALRGGKVKGKLLQVATGEGKSTIICILAIISACEGRQWTWSPVLQCWLREMRSKRQNCTGCFL